MPTMPPDDVAAMFDLPPLPVESPPSASCIEDEEAALAAELAATIAAGELAGDAPDSRTHFRVDVSWPARMQLPNGRVIELKVRNVSERGVGLVSDEDIPAHAVVDFEMDVPQSEKVGAATAVKGTIKTTYTVAQGSGIFCGGIWQVPPIDLQVVKAWLERLAG